MLLVVVLTFLAQSAPPALSPFSVAAPAFSLVRIDPSEGGFFEQHLAQALIGQGVKVTTRKEIEAVLGIERNRALLGCSTDSESCMTEIGASLGADAVLIGDIGKFGSRIQLNFKLVSSRTSAVLVAYSGQASPGEEVLSRLDEAAVILAGAIPMNRRLPVKATVRRSGVKLAAGIGLLAFAVWPAVVGTTHLMARNEASSVQAGAGPTAQAAYEPDIARFTLGAASGLGVAAAAVAGGIFLVATSDETVPATVVSAAYISDSAGVSVSGRF